MTDPLDQVLRLVAEGRLTAEEAAPIIDALQAAGEAGDDAAATRPTPTSRRRRYAGSTGRDDPADVRCGSRSRRTAGRSSTSASRSSLGRMGIDRIPGLSADNISRIRQALDEGLTGPILAVDEDGEGNGVRIVLE